MITSKGSLMKEIWGSPKKGPRVSESTQMLMNFGLNFRFN